MAELDLKPNTTFEINSVQAVTSEDLQVLTLLYQPLIGPQPISLFLTLQTLGNTTLAHHLLLQIFNTNMEQFLQWRQKLEGVGLIQTYLMQDTHVRYHLRKPLTAKSFFSDGIINVFLNLKVGNGDYQQLKQFFIQPEPESKGQLISKTFNDIFDTTVLLRPSLGLQASPLPQTSGGKDGIELEYVFNKELLFSLLKKRDLDDQHLSEKLLDQVNKTAFLYKLDEHELSRIIFDAVNPDGFVNMDTFRKLAKQHFQFLNKGKPIEVVERNVTEQAVKAEPPLREGSKKEKLIEFFAQNPIDFLRYKSHQKEPVPADRQLVEWLFMDQQMPHDVVNVLVDYVLKVSDGRLPKQLVEKIAGEWQRKNINTSEKAMAQVKRVRAATKKRETEKKIPASQKPTRVVRQEQVPDWLKEPQPSKAQDLNKDDLQKIERMKQLQQQILKK